jgi:hypothetical protein
VPHACRAAAISECSCGFSIGVRRKIFAVEFDQAEGADDNIRGVSWRIRSSLFSWKRILAWMAPREYGDR